MITGMHLTVFTPHAEEMRSFIRDKLGFRSADAGGGWLIFELPNAELAPHPTDKEGFQTKERPPDVVHEPSFYCDDIHATMAELKERGVVFTTGVMDQGYALMARFLMPGGLEVDLYQPRYETDFS